AYPLRARVLAGLQVAGEQRLGAQLVEGRHLVPDRQVHVTRVAFPVLVPRREKYRGKYGESGTRCETVRMYDYDVLVLGSGPGGQKAAIAAAKLDRKVAVVERRHMIGGVCINTGTIPSKTLREAVLYLTGLNQR